MCLNEILQRKNSFTPIHQTYSKKLHYGNAGFLITEKEAWYKPAGEDPHSIPYAVIKTILQQHLVFPPVDKFKEYLLSCPI